jgi:hypothetical protein
MLFYRSPLTVTKDKDGTLTFERETDSMLQKEAEVLLQITPDGKPIFRGKSETDPSTRDHAEQREMVGEMLTALKNRALLENMSRYIKGLKARG